MYLWGQNGVAERFSSIRSHMRCHPLTPDTRSTTHRRQTSHNIECAPPLATSMKLSQIVRGASRRAPLSPRSGGSLPSRPPLKVSGPPTPAIGPNEDNSFTRHTLNETRSVLDAIAGHRQRASHGPRPRCPETLCKVSGHGVRQKLRRGGLAPRPSTSDELK